VDLGYKRSWELLGSIFAYNHIVKAEENQMSLNSIHSFNHIVKGGENQMSFNSIHSFTK
jgi:hypothetical protein